MRKKSRVRCHKTAAERAEVLAAYQKRTVSPVRFAAEHGLAVSTLYGWLRREQLAPRRPREALIEIPNLWGRRCAAPTYRLLFPRGMVLELPSGFAPDELRSLAQLIQSL
jgi:hypothetical protein